ncbi:hypothetical protein M501DRAFT_1018354 [Patellaria atrata CBS 101060]|uniref:Mediator of RNA polymerase II transcription subunit 8 n=1 Tax=Patellaria atrata CBS 101060 TaxID=1346257 RepID=A0A9P4S850_9PEZI|nr:hypothetical protein M501DRAFT_1018354 [Patellaria atrata CBS 101060]
MDNPEPLTEIQQLEQIRQRLVQFIGTLEGRGSIAHYLDQYDPMPNWPLLQTSFNNATAALQSLNTIISTDENQALLRSMHVHPLPTMKKQENDNVVSSLLRKKLETDAEEFVEDARKRGEAIRDREPGTGMSTQELRELWEWAGPAANDIAKAVLVDGQDVEGEDSEEGDEEGDEEDDKGNEMDTETMCAAEQMTPLEDILRFSMTGKEPEPRTAPVERPARR